MTWVEVSGKTKKSEIVDEEIDVEEIKTVSQEEYPKFHIMAFDIETVSGNDGDKIIMVSFVDNKGFKQAVSYGSKSKVSNTVIVKNEEDLIKTFVSTINKIDPDILVGYNTDKFDFKKLTEAADKYKIGMNIGRDGTKSAFVRRGFVSAAKIKGRVHIDLYDFVETVLGDTLKTEVLTLDRVARELIGEGKKDFSWTEIRKSWKKGDIKKIAEYCINDSEITLKLAEILLIQVFELSKVVGQTPFDVSRMAYSQLVEWLLIRHVFIHEGISPNRPSYDEIQRRKAHSFIGGYVFTPKEGIHENLALFDFRSLYPTITIAHNVSTETLDCDCCMGNKVPEKDYHFCQKKEGFIPRIVTDLIKKRQEIKKKMEKFGERSITYKSLYNRQYALKILANSIYGYYAYPGSRWYSRVCAESIAKWGRYYIKNVIDLAEDLGFPVVYGDTDSLFIKIKFKKNIKDFLKKANETLPGIMELEFESLYKTGIFVLAKTGTAAKKRYALVDEDGNMIIRGFEIVRRDWSSIAKDMQEKVLTAILKDKSEVKAVKIIRETIKKLKNNKAEMEELTIYTQITKPIEEYGITSPHVSAAKKMLIRGGSLKIGSTVGYVITKGDGSISERAEPVEYAKNYDPEYYIRNQVIPAAVRIMSSLGYTEADLLSEQKSPTLKQFFR